MSQDTGHAGESASMQPRPPIIMQGYPAGHVAPGYEHIFCQCGCGAPLEAAGAVHAAAQQQHQQHQHHQPPNPRGGAQVHAPTFRGALRGAQGIVHPHPQMYGTAPPSYPRGHPDMRQLHSQLAAAAAMTQYANYGRGLSDLDPYRNAHMAAYRPPVEFPPGFVVPPHGAAAYLPPGAHHLNYYRQFLGDFSHVSGRDSRAEGTVISEATAATTLSGSAATAHPKESILESLLAARSDRAAAAAAAANRELSPAVLGRDDSLPPPAEKATVSAGKPQVAASTKPVDGDTPPSPVTKVPKSTGTKAHEARTPREQAPLVASPLPARQKGVGMEEATVPVATKVAAAAAAGGGGGGGKRPASDAVTAMHHLTGFHKGFPGDVHAMKGVGIASPTLQAVPSVGGLGMPYLPSALAPPLPPSQAAAVMGSHSVGLSNHDTYEERLRQQEKKLQKRAANRKSAQLSRKRKKALIEELRYENLDLQRHEDILEVIPDPVFAFDTADGRVWFASNSASAQFGLPLEDLISACFFDLMTEDCSKRLRVLIDAASKDVSETNSALLHERMTVRFKKRKSAIHLGELSGRLSKQGDVITAVCSVRPLSIGTEEVLGKGYIGDASMSEVAEATSADQGSSGEDSRSAGTGQTSSNADSSSGLGTGCTSIADEASSSGVPSLSSLQVKRGGSTCRGSDTGNAGGHECGGRIGGGSTGSAGVSTGSGATGEGSTGSGGSEEGGLYNSNSDYALSSSGGQEIEDETHTDSDGGGRRKKKRARVVMPRSSGSAADSSVGGGWGAVGFAAPAPPRGGDRSGSSSNNNSRRGGDCRSLVAPPAPEMPRKGEEAALEVRHWEVSAGLKSGHGGAADSSESASKRHHHEGLGKNRVP